jgi:hypothetical protein
MYIPSIQKIKGVRDPQIQKVYTLSELEADVPIIISIY